MQWIISCYNINVSCSSKSTQVRACRTGWVGSGARAGCSGPAGCCSHRGAGPHRRHIYPHPHIRYEPIWYCDDLLKLPDEPFKIKKNILGPVGKLFVRSIIHNLKLASVEQRSFPNSSFLLQVSLFNAEYTINKEHFYHLYVIYHFSNRYSTLLLCNKVANL